MAVLIGLDGYVCLQSGTGWTTDTGTVAFPLRVVPAQAVGQRTKPARKSTSAATGGFACANRVCCVFISPSFPDPLSPLGEVLAESSRHAERASHWGDQPHNDWQHTKAVTASTWPSLATSATSPFRFRDQHSVCQRRFGATYRASSRTLGAPSTTRREIA